VTCERAAELPDLPDVPARDRMVVQPPVWGELILSDGRADLWFLFASGRLMALPLKDIEGVSLS
jgi:hypothetical protein